MNSTRSQTEHELALLGTIDGVGRQMLLRIESTQKKHKVTWRDFWVPTNDIIKKVGLQKRSIEHIKKCNYEQKKSDFILSLKKLKIRVVGKHNAEYPVLLAQVVGAPAVLYIKGAVAAWKSGLVTAVIGSRNATRYGRSATETLVTELVGVGHTICSGGMYGIDMMAHQAAVAAGGATVVFLGHGMNRCYPQSLRRTHLELAQNKQVTWISEFHPDCQPTRGTFIARNSLVAGSCERVLVIEAAAQSGTQSTVQFALDEGKDVYAVPGPFTSLYSEGTKALLNAGARMYTGIKDL